MDGNEYAADQLKKKVEGLESKVKDLEGKIPKPKPPPPAWILLVLGVTCGMLLMKLC